MDIIKQSDLGQALSLIFNRFSNDKGHSMNIKVHDLMISPVISTVPHKSVGHVKDIMKKNHIKLVPVVNPENELEGIVSSADLLGEGDERPVSHVMVKDVVSIPAYSDISEAARAMRNRKIHHLVVTHEKKLAGIISTFDLLKLVEDKRFVMKNPPTPSKKKRRNVSGQ